MFSFVVAAVLSLPSLAQAEYADTEVVTNVVCRGLDAPNPQIDCSMESTPMTIRMR